YIDAAWLLTQNADVADHLRQTYEKEGKLADARHMQLLAAAARPLPANATMSARESADRGKYLQEIQNLRTIEISGLPKKAAAAQFWLIFTPQGIEEVKMITGDPSLSSAVDLLKKHAYPQTFPDPGPVKIVRRGILSCSQFNPTCQLVLLQPQWTQL
ncbi:MAG: hypothetical protein WA430_17340, partial [Acidobacteriaceae bacterium]